MADKIFVEVGKMAVKKGKVPKEIVAKAPKIMFKTACKAVDSNNKFTSKSPGKDAKGFFIDFTLVGVVEDAKKKQIEAQFSGVVATMPKKKMITSSLTSSAKVAMSGKGDAEYIIEEGLKGMMKKDVLPFLEKQK